MAQERDLFANFERMRREMDGTVSVIATGGLAPLIADVAKSIQHVNPDLTLEGLRLVWHCSQWGGSARRTSQFRGHGVTS